MAYEKGHIRVDRGEFIDKLNYHCDPRHPDFAGGADGDGLRNSYQAFLECDAFGVANGVAGVVGPGTYLINSNLTLAAGWDLHDGAILKPASGVTVTFTGQVRGWGSRATIFDTSLGGAFTTTGGEWFFNGNGFAGGSLLDMGGMVKNVLAYDVTGDGTTDDTAAIQAVLDDAVDGDTIFFPAGDYKITADLDLETSGVTILGLGRSARIFTTVTNVNVFEIAAGVSRLTIEGLHLQAAGKEWAADADRQLGNCIWTASTTGNRSTHIRVRGCKIQDGHNGVVLRYTNYGEIVGNHIETAYQSWTGYTLWACNHCTTDNVVISTHASGAPTAVELDPAEAGADTCDWNKLSDVIKGTWDNEGYNIGGAHNTVTGASVDVTGSAVQILNGPGVSISYVVQNNKFVGCTLRTTSDTFRAVGLKDQSVGNYGVTNNTFEACEITQAGAGQGVTVEGYCARNTFSNCTITGGNGATSDAVIFTGTGNTRNKLINCRVTGAGRNGFLGNAVAYPHVESCEFYANANGVSFTTCSNPTWINNHTHDNVTTSATISSSTGFVRAWGNVSESETAPNMANTLVLFTSLDATPSVKNGTRFRTANAGATTITAFDDGVTGQRIWVQINDSNTTLDLTSTTLKVLGRTTDYTCVSGDVVEGEFDGTNWVLTLHTAKRMFLDELNTWTATQVQSVANTSAGAWTTKVTGESNNRYQQLGGGTAYYGTGSAAADADFGRIGTTALGAGSATLLQAGSGAWDAGHLFFSDGHHVFIGGTAQLRIKFGTPLSSSDGSRIPTQIATITQALPGNGVIAALTSDATTTQAQFNALRDQCEILRDWCAEVLSKGQTSGVFT